MRASPCRFVAPRRRNVSRFLDARAEAQADEWFGTQWTSRTGEWADRLNSLSKYVMSSTLEHPAWTNATLLKGDVVTEVSKLKRERDGDIVVYASSQRIRQPPHLSAPVLLPRREEPPPTAPVLTPPRRQVISAWLDLQVTAALTGSAYVALLVGGL